MFWLMIVLMVVAYIVTIPVAWAVLSQISRKRRGRSRVPMAAIATARIANGQKSHPRKVDGSSTQGSSASIPGRLAWSQPATTAPMRT